MPEKLDQAEQRLVLSAASTPEWTIGTVREYFLRILLDVERRLDERISAQKDAVAVAMLAADRAVTKAENATEKRFESVNEFRQALGDNARLQMPRVEIDGLFRAHDEKLNTAIEALSKRVDSLTELVVRDEGKQRGIHAGWGYAVGAIGLIGVVVAVVSVILVVRGK